MSTLKAKLEWFCHHRSKCSCWFDSLFGKYWGDCCQEHDNDYIEQRTSSKQEADLKLLECLKKKSWKPMAYLMHYGNKIFSWYYWEKYRRLKHGDRGL